MSWTQRVLDNFTDSGSLNLANHTPDQGSSYSSPGVTDALSWVTNAAGTAATPGGTNALTFNDTPLKPNHAIEVKVVTNQTVDLVARGSARYYDALFGYVGRYDQAASQVKLFRVDDGVFTQLGSSVGVTFAANMVLRLECEEHTIRVLLDGVEKISQQDEVHCKHGKVGLHVPSTSIPIVDQLQVFDSSPQRNASR